VLDRRYQGTQTIYDIDLYGQKLEVLELGTAARYEVGANVPISLPRDALWAYRDQSPAVEWSRPSAHGDVQS
jgi:iron(III) transport system ATP-binding protein